MKAIMIDKKKIISLENVRSIQFHEGGSGAKSNPFYYNIYIHYKDDIGEETPQTNDKNKAYEWFNQMYAILTAD